MPQEVDSKIGQLIERAVKAGAFSAAARRYPRSAVTFVMASALNSAAVARLAEDVAMAPTLARRVNRHSAP